MAAQRDLKVCHDDLRRMRKNGSCKTVQCELKRGRRSLRQKVKRALQEGDEPIATDSIRYMY
jgi:hypothetical protein